MAVRGVVPALWALVAICAVLLVSLAAGRATPAHAVANCVITPRADITVANDPNQAGAVVNYAAPVQTGTCGGVTVTCTPASGSFRPLGVSEITCSNTEGSRDSFLIIVNDTQPPLIGGLTNVSAPNTPGLSTALISFPPPSASDNAPGVTVSCNRPSPSLFAIGATSVTCTARDVAGNTAMGTRVITVLDVEAPVLDVPGAVNATAAAGQRQVAVTYAAVTSHDNSGTSPIPTCDRASGSGFPVGTTTVNCRATDAAGNSRTASFAVVVTGTKCKAGKRASAARKKCKKRK
jgi:HYR domain